MAVSKEIDIKGYISYLKDFVYIIGLGIALFGWISSKSKSEAILETTVKYNTEAVQKFEKFITNQSVLNGKVIQYMEMDAHPGLGN